MTTIFSNNEDIDCEVLRTLFSNIPNNHVIELTYSMRGSDWDELVEQALEIETDTLILCGHGSNEGLYFPRFEEYVIHRFNVNRIHARRVICSWCHASMFVMEHNVHNCLATSMFISNIHEACENGYMQPTQEDINNVCQRIDSEINSLIMSDSPISEWQMIIGSHMDVENEIDMFNRQGIIYNE